MNVYYALVALILLFALLLHGERRGNTKFILLAVTLMFCVYGLRDAYTVGNDVNSYRFNYERLGDTDWSELPTLNDWLHSADEDEDKVGHERNIANSWLMKVVHEVTDGDYQVYVTLVSAFIMLVFLHYIRRYSPSPVQSVLYFFGLLYFTFNFSALKQSVAMAIVLLSFDAIADRKLLRFLLLTAVASMFHFPALVFLPAYWVADMRLGRTYLLFLALLFVATYFLRDNLVDWMTDTYDTQINEDSSMRFLANKVIVMLVIIVAALVIRPPHPSDRLYCSLLMLMGVAAVIQTFASYNNTFERLADYYFQFAVVFIPMVFEDVKLKRRHLSERELKMVRKIGPYVFCAFAIWRFFNFVSNDETLNHYQFYFQAEKAAEELLSGRFL